MKRTHKRILLVASALVLLLGVGTFKTAKDFFDGKSPRNLSRAKAAVHGWARVAPFPESAELTALDMKGSIFTRECTVSFHAPAEDVKTWLAASPGTQGVNPQARPDGSLLYAIQPGGGAQFAEVVVSADGMDVRIRTYWS